MSLPLRGARRSVWPLAGLAFASLLLSACAGTRAYALGIPVQAAPALFEHLEVVARHHGLTAARSQLSLELQTHEGDRLSYRPYWDQIVLTVSPNIAGLDEQQITARQARLKTLSDALVADARASEHAQGRYLRSLR